MLHGDVVDQLLNQHGLSDARAAEQSDLSALQVRLDEVHDLDAGLEHFEIGGLVLQGRRRTVNRVALFVLHGPEVVHRFAEHVHHAAERAAAYWHGDRLSEVFRLHPAHQAFARLHRDGADAALAEVLLDFDDEVDRIRNVEPFAGDAHGAVNLRQVPFGKLHVHDRANDFDHAADFCLVCCHFSSL